MKLRDRERLVIINDLVSNCDCWKQEGDRELLEGFSDEKLVNLRAALEKSRQALTVANAAIAGFSDGQGNAFRINPQTNRWERAVLNKKDEDDEDEDDEDEEEEGTEEERATKGGGLKTGRGGRSARAAKGGGVSNQDRTQDQRRVAGKGGSGAGKGTRNRREEQTETPREPAPRRPRTPDEWLRMAPQEIQNTLRVAREIEQREKDKIINEILTNVSEKERSIHRERLQRRSLAELEDDRALFPKQPTREEVERAVASNSKRQAPKEEQDMLVAPTINWQEVGPNPSGNGSRRSAFGDKSTVSNSGTLDSSASVSPVDDGSEEEWLRGAPASIRMVVQNAMAVDARERSRLLDELISNMSVDEETERRLLQRFQNKPLDELRDLAAMLPNRDSLRQPLYLGQSAGVVVNQGDNSSEDLLPLPSIEWGAESRNGRRRD